MFQVAGIQSEQEFEWHAHVIHILTWEHMQLKKYMMFRFGYAFDYYSSSLMFHLQALKFISQAPDPFIQAKSLNLPVRTEVFFFLCSYFIIILCTQGYDRNSLSIGQTS